VFSNLPLTAIVHPFPLPAKTDSPDLQASIALATNQNQENGYCIRRSTKAFVFSFPNRNESWLPFLGGCKKSILRRTYLSDSRLTGDVKDFGRSFLYIVEKAMVN
jgi:hypothetical protein